MVCLLAVLKVVMFLTPLSVLFLFCLSRSYSLPWDRKFWSTLEINMLQSGTKKPSLLPESVFKKPKQHMTTITIIHITKSWRKNQNSNLWVKFLWSILLPKAEASQVLCVFPRKKSWTHYLCWLEWERPTGLHVWHLTPTGRSVWKD